MKARKPADDPDEKFIQAITDLPILIAKLERHLFEIEAKQGLILQYQKSPADKIETASKAFETVLQHSNDQIDASRKAFEATVKAWLPVKWSSLPMWLDGIDQRIRLLEDKIKELCEILRQFARTPAPAPDPKFRGLLLGAMQEIATVLKDGEGKR